MIKPRPLAERFWPKVQKTDGCWNWLGAKSSGYGKISINGARMGYAHRVTYEFLVGAIPSGMTIDHLCRNRRCVNPAHLEVVTMSENTRRGMGPYAVNGRKTECVNGHPFTPENTAIYQGRRHCRECYRVRNRSEAHRAAKHRYRARLRQRSAA